jgi:hypothetical protein
MLCSYSERPDYRTQYQRRCGDFLVHPHEPSRGPLLATRISFPRRHQRQAVALACRLLFKKGAGLTIGKLAKPTCAWIAIWVGPRHLDRKGWQE